MSIEQAMSDLTKALNENTAALKGAGKATSGSTSGAGSASGYTPKHTQAEMMAALNEVKEKHGTEAAKALIKDPGGKAKMAEITDPETIDKVYKAAKKKLEDDGM